MTDEDNARALVDGLEVPDDVVDVRTLNHLELLKRQEQIRKQLYDLGEMHGEPKTEAGRDLHSQRTACLVEMSRRGLR